MHKEPHATILLAGQRGVTQSEQYRSWHCFNHGRYQVPHREAPGALRVFNEDTLAGGHHLVHTVEQAVEVLLLPLVGEIAFKHLGETHYLSAGSILSIHLAPGMVFEIGNPYVEDLVSYLHIEIAGANESATALPVVRSFNLDAHPNALSPLGACKLKKGQFLGQIGKFSGRAEASYLPRNPTNDCFVFVIEGAFEVQNRLLHTRDGLLLLVWKKWLGS